MDPPELRAKVARVFAASGHLSGPEYYAVVSQTGLELMGVDDPDLYLKNLAQFKHLRRLARSADTRRHMEALRRGLRRRWNQKGLEAVADLYRMEERHRRGVISHDEYVKQLLRLARKQRIPLPACSDWWN